MGEVHGFSYTLHGGHGRRDYRVNAAQGLSTLRVDSAGRGSLPLSAATAKWDQKIFPLSNIIWKVASLGVYLCKIIFHNTLS